MANEVVELDINKAVVTPEVQADALSFLVNRKFKGYSLSVKPVDYSQ